jgi:GNAT superfamily N-acetyltransferase
MGTRSASSIRTSGKSSFRSNSISDIEAIAALNNRELLSRDGERGFMLYPLTALDVSSSMLSGVFSGAGGVISHYAPSGEVDGFIMYRATDPYILEVVPGLEEVCTNIPELCSQRGLLIEKILVAPEARGSGIAGELLERMLDASPGTDFVVSTVVGEPICNRASVDFHLGHGFTEVNRAVQDLRDDYLLGIDAAERREKLVPGMPTPPEEITDIVFLRRLR